MYSISMRCFYFLFLLKSLTQNFRKFLQRMLDPSVGTGAVDVYAWMFSAQFIIFIIILSNWSAFSSSEVILVFLLKTPLETVKRRWS